MVGDEDYIEVDAVVRMPKGERLADSRKTEGWSRGFTPKSTDKGPGHVEIRLKNDGEGALRDTTPAEPHVIFIHELTDPQPQRTREQEEFEEALQLLVRQALIKAAEWAKPHLKRLWDERVIPFLSEKRHQWQELRTRRKAAVPVTVEGPAAVAQGISADGLNKVSTALEAYSANMTSAEARQHFAQALIAQHFANEKMRLLANARIVDGALPRELGIAVQALTPKQAKTALDSILAAKPTLLDDLGKALALARHDDRLRLEHNMIKASLHITDGQVLGHGACQMDCVSDLVTI